MHSKGQKTQLQFQILKELTLIHVVKMIDIKERLTHKTKLKMYMAKFIIKIKSMDKRLVKLILAYKIDLQHAKNHKQISKALSKL
jgi:hypothetical protein